MSNALNPIGYVTQPEQAAKIGRGVVMLRKMACRIKDERQRDDHFKASFAFWNFSQLFDDLVDNSGWDAQKKLLALRGLQDFVVALLANPVYRDHAGAFEGLFVTAIARVIAGDEFERSKDARERALAPAIKCADIDVFAYFAHLAGGFDFMQEMGSRNELRKYDFGDVKPELKAEVACV